jgi:uncharacterized protein YbaA (DUF1428 family)
MGMAKYVDGFVIPLKKKDLAAYKRMATWGRTMWMKYGALEYFECAGDDLEVHEGCGLGFRKGTRLKPNETVVFAFIIYRSKAHRDAVNKKVLSDPSMKKLPPRMPFEVMRMMHGGFKVLVEG